jgi:predicted component of type VI protein secretion system
MAAKLMIQSHKEGLLKEISLDRPRITIGRKQGNDLQFNRPEISGSHAAFLYENENYFVTDLGSTNGTLLNGARLVSGQRYQLQNKDVITITPFSITFILDKDMLDTYREQPASAMAGRSGTEVDVVIKGKIRTGTEEHKIEQSRMEQTYSEGESKPPAPAPEPPPVPQATPPKEAEPKAAPEAKPPEPSGPAAVPSGSPAPPAPVTPVKEGGISIYVWLGIGAIFVLVAIVLVAMLFIL